MRTPSPATTRDRRYQPAGGPLPPEAGNSYEDRLPPA